MGQPDRDRRAGRRRSPGRSSTTGRTWSAARRRPERRSTVSLGRRRPGRRDHGRGPEHPRRRPGSRYAGAERIPSEIVDPEGGITRLHVADGLVRRSRTPTASRSGSATTPTATSSRPSTPPAVTARIERDAAGLPTRGGHPGRAAHRAVHDGPAGWSSAATRPAACGATSTAPRAGATAVVDPTGSRTETPYGAHGDGRRARRRARRGHHPGVRRVRQPRRPSPTPDGGKWAFRHDALSRLTAWTDPAGGTWLQRARRRRQPHRGRRPHRRPHAAHLRPGRPAHRRRRRPGRHRHRLRRAGPARSPSM